MCTGYCFKRHTAFHFRSVIREIPQQADAITASGQTQFLENDMTTFKLLATGGLRLAAAVASITAVTGLASAGECPAGKMKEGAVTSGPTAPAGVTDTVIGSIDLTPKGGDFKDQLLRLRQLTIAPGGIVPWHEHSTRPANIYVLSGTIEEYRASCSVPIVHKAGDVAQEFGKGFAHWWKNTGSEPVVLLSADVFDNVKADDHMM
jgi:quercetin dioxygenase-like cupin family protein